MPSAVPPSERPFDLEGYRAIEIIGRGGFGHVWSAEHLALGRLVAIKVLRNVELTEDADLRERFYREARIVAQMSNHENIVQVFDIKEVGGVPGIIMELVDGQSLGEMLSLRGRLPLRLAIDIIAQTALGLHHAHTHGVIHRDVKPENIMITSAGTAKVMDFGIARGATVSRMTATGLLVGTPQYMAPEQWDARWDIDHRADIYSLSVVLFHVVCGRPPFSEPSWYSLGMKHINTPPPSPKSITPYVPPLLESIILKGMAKVPAERFQTALDLHRALIALLSQFDNTTEATSTGTTSMSTGGNSPLTGDSAHLSGSPQFASHPYDGQLRQGRKPRHSSAQGWQPEIRIPPPPQPYRGPEAFEQTQFRSYLPPEGDASVEHQQSHHAVDTGAVTIGWDAARAGLHATGAAEPVTRPDIPALPRRRGRLGLLVLALVLTLGLAVLTAWFLYPERTKDWYRLAMMRGSELLGRWGRVGMPPESGRHAITDLQLTGMHRSELASAAQDLLEGRLEGAYARLSTTTTAAPGVSSEVWLREFGSAILAAIPQASSKSIVAAAGGKGSEATALLMPPADAIMVLDFTTPGASADRREGLSFSLSLLPDLRSPMYRVLKRPALIRILGEARLPNTPEELNNDKLRTVARTAGVRFIVRGELIQEPGPQARVKVYDTNSGEVVIDETVIASSNAALRVELSKAGRRFAEILGNL